MSDGDGLPRYQDLIEDYAILDGIPEERIDLEAVANKPRLDCNTIACGIGWMLLHPKWQARGFGLTPAPSTVTKYGLLITTPAGVRFPGYDFANVAMQMYNLPYEDAVRLFNTAGGDDGNGGFFDSDKEELLSRIRTYLREHGVIA